MDVSTQETERERMRELILATLYATGKRDPAAAYVDGPYPGERPSYSPDELLYSRVSAATSPWLVVSGCALMIMAGSGGVLTSLEPTSLSGGRPVFHMPVLFSRSEKSKVLSTPECIRVLKNLLGLTLSDLADFMLVGRPAIYDWLGGAQPRRRSLDRLWQLHGIALFWSNLSKTRLGNWVHTPFNDGHTLYTLLMASDLVVDDIHRDLRLLAVVANQGVFVEGKGSISDRLRKAGFQRPPADTRNASKQQIGPSWVDEE